MILHPLIASAVPLNAESVFGEVLDIPYLEWLTNSVFVNFIVVAIIATWARSSTRHMQVVPSGSQNLFEALVEGLYTLLEGIVGKHMVGRSFSFLASLFIFILVSNWFGLLPGVGSIGWGEKVGPLSLGSIEVPLFRPTTADLNMTLGLAAIAMILWLVWSLQEVGIGGMIKHIFGVKGGMTGAIGAALVPVFFFVGLLEVISIATRPVSLSLRLFGNIYAGENLLGMMMGLGKELHWPPLVAAISSIVIPIPFYGLELMVGLLQAFVFMLLCSVYLQLSTTHEDEPGH